MLKRCVGDPMMTQQFFVDGAGGLSTLSVWHVKVTYFGWQRSGAAAEGGREGFGGEAPAAAADMTRPSWEQASSLASVMAPDEQQNGKFQGCSNV